MATIYYPKHQEIASNSSEPKHQEIPSNSSEHQEIPRNSSKHQDIPSNSSEPTHPSPSTPQVFRISDNEDIEVLIPHRIANYDLTEKHWESFKSEIPDKLDNDIEKLTSVKMKAEEEYKHHPNDEFRFLYLESLKSQHATLIHEALRCFTNDESGSGSEHQEQTNKKNKKKKKKINN